jgi:hypothetical protein
MTEAKKISLSRPWLSQRENHVVDCPGSIWKLQSKQGSPSTPEEERADILEYGLDKLTRTCRR